MKIVSVGCSFTEGQGLENQTFQCYTHLLATKLGLEYHNYGSAGASNDYIFRKILGLIENNIIDKKDIILIQWTHYNRKELPIIYNDKKWYHYPPNTYHPISDKIFIEKLNGVKDENYDNDGHLDLNKIKMKNEKLLDIYTFNFLHDEYQQNTTKNYINTLYTYLEYNEYKHIHFFGWKPCVIENINENKTNFLNENFGEFTNTINPGHPDKKGHLDWANHLYEKIKTFDYLKDCENYLKEYKKNYKFI